ncbi:hypothetical protein ASV53_18725 [Photobacterium sanguinicancri]|uniref:Transposase n=1 Tax=Photobacterium sanguinicancri TaxID=875932 RepID=A0ABX4FU24_9GAMM|nr:hypothetical protein ASV53_18725 [Photobacterium sanguinicancri]
MAEALDIHPFMLSKWRNAYKDEVIQMVKSKDLAKPKKLNRMMNLKALDSE